MQISHSPRRGGVDATSEKISRSFLLSHFQHGRSFVFPMLGLNGFVRRHHPLLRARCRMDRGACSGPTGPRRPNGIQADYLTPQLREFFGVGANEGVLVASVETDSAAAKAGLKAGDVITAVEGKRISTPQDFSHEVRSAGLTVTLTIVRDKQEREIKIEGVARRPAGPQRERIKSSEVNVL